MSKWDGARMQEIYINIFKKELSNKVYTGMEKYRQRINGCFEVKSMFRPSVDWVFLPTCHALEAWFELYRNHLKGNKNYFELAGGSSYRGFALQRVKLQ